MRTFSKTANESDFISAAKEWLSLLELGPDDGYQKAWAFLHHPAEEHWSLQLMKDSIETYGAPYDEEKPDKPYFVTKVDEEIPVAFYQYTTGPNRGTLEIDLPLNGEICQLTAQIAIVSTGENFAFLLDDIHVL